MKCQTPIGTMVLLLVGLVCTAHPVAAEWFVDMYGGVGFVEKDDVSIEKDTTGEGLSVSSISATLKDVEIDDFATGGLRIGYWLTGFRPLGLNLGLGFDAFLFQLETSSQTVDSDSNVDINLRLSGEEFTILAGDNQTTQLPSMDTLLTAVLSVELMVRKPLLTSAQYPNGRLQPYVTLAPAFIFTDEDRSGTTGWKVGAGLAWQWHRAFALFTEYRWSHFELEYDDTAVEVEGITSSNPKVEFDLTSHYILAGIRVDLSALFAPRKQRTPRRSHTAAPLDRRLHNDSPIPTAQPDARLAQLVTCLDAAYQAIHAAKATGAPATELAPARSALANAEHALARARTLLAHGKVAQARLHLEAAQAACRTARQHSRIPRVSPARRTPAPVKRYTVRHGDTLWGIAAQGRVYQNPYMWPLLYRANRYQIHDPDLIYPQQIFTIPRRYLQEESDAATRRARKRGPWHLGDGPDVYILEGIRR